MLREAVAREDLPETIGLAERLRAGFPLRADGYMIGARALRESKRLDEVDAVAPGGHDLLPGRGLAFVEAQWGSCAGRSHEAIQRAEQLRHGSRQIRPAIGSLPACSAR